MAMMINLMGEAVEADARRRGDYAPFEPQRWHAAYRVSDAPNEQGCATLAGEFFKWVHYDLRKGDYPTYRWLWSEEFAIWVSILAPRLAPVEVRDVLIRDYWRKGGSMLRTTRAYNLGERSA